MKLQNINTGTTAGIFVIVIGTMLLAMVNGWGGLSISNTWPIYILLPGLALLVGSTRLPGAFLSGLLIFLGVHLLLLGAFFFIFSLELLQWHNLKILWPIFPLVFGLSLLAAYARSQSRLLLSAGTSASITSIALLVLLAVGVNIGPIWPLFIILFGVVLVFSARSKK